MSLRELLSAPRRSRDDGEADADRDASTDRADPGDRGSDAEPPAVELDDVTVALGGVTALEAVDAAVERGRFVGLVGPNGAGKTTLLRTITGVLSPDAGTVRLDGVDVARLSARAVSRQVAMVPQDTSLAFDFDVREAVAMGRTPYVSRLGRGDDAGPAVVRDAMARTAVDHLADRSVGAVSGGERQRVLLARALAQDTPVLLLDEPTASLDINHQVRTLELVADLASEGRAVVAAIHDLNLAAHYCDELLLLGDGRPLASGPPAAVLTEDHLEAAFDTRAAVTRHPVTGSTYVSALPDRTARAGRGRVHVVGGGGTAARLLYLLSAAGYDVSAGVLNQGDADLETARLLGAETVTVEPFAPVDADAYRRARDLVTDADAVVVADIEVGVGNVDNLRLAGAGPPVVVVEERPFEERNYAGAEARARYRELRARGDVVDPGAVIGRVTHHVDASRDGDEDGRNTGSDGFGGDAGGDGDGDVGGGAGVDGDGGDGVADAGAGDDRA